MVPRLPGTAALGGALAVTSPEGQALDRCRRTAPQEGRQTPRLAAGNRGWTPCPVLAGFEGPEVGVTLPCSRRRRCVLRPGIARCVCCFRCPPPVSGGACSSSGVFVSFLLAWRGGSLLWRRRGRRGLGAAGAPSHVPQPLVAQGWCRLPRRPEVACGAELARIWARRGGVRGGRPPGALLRKPHPGQGATGSRRSGREARFALSALRFGSRQNSASCDLLGNFPDNYIKVPQNTQAQEAGGAPRSRCPGKRVPVG